MPAEGLVEAFGGVAGASVEDEKSAVFGIGKFFHGLHELAGDALAAGFRMDEEFGDFGTVAAVGRGGEVELDGADGFSVEAGDEEFDFIGGEGWAKFLPVGEGGFEGERKEEADTGSVGNAGLEDGG